MILTIPFSKTNINIESPIVVYGAGVYGEIAYLALNQCGLSIDFFCDRYRTGEFLGVRIITPKMLKDIPDSQVIIASRDYFYEIKKVLISCGFKRIYDMRELIAMNLPVEKLSNRARDMYFQRQVYIHVANHQGDILSNIHRLQFIVTERCSLKCKDCTHLMQYYEKPQDVDITKYIVSFERLLNMLGTISELRILGGEPFMNRETYKLIKRYASNNKINMITVYSNGTIIPNEDTLKTLENDKVTLHISAYGEHNKKRIDELTKCLNQYNIKYIVRVYDSWQEGGNLTKRHYSEAHKRKIFSACFERSCYSFLRGKLHRCPRSAHAMNLQAMPDVSNDYVDFTDENMSDEELKMKLLDLQNREWIEACDYCEGPNNVTQHIIPAIQTKFPLKYEKINNSKNLRE
ncbi:MAG: radical SAM protein [Butyrivibrio sp.]|nr:radical SAM protein [Butyrivibrio sp.]